MTKAVYKQVWAPEVDEPPVCELEGPIHWLSTEEFKGSTRNVLVALAKRRREALSAEVKLDDRSHQWLKWGLTRNQIAHRTGLAPDEVSQALSEAYDTVYVTYPPAALYGFDYAPPSGVGCTLPVLTEPQMGVLYSLRREAAADYIRVSREIADALATLGFCELLQLPAEPDVPAKPWSLHSPSDSVGIRITDAGRGFLRNRCGMPEHWILSLASWESLKVWAGGICVLVYRPVIGIREHYSAHISSDETASRATGRTAIAAVQLALFRYRSAVAQYVDTLWGCDIAGEAQ